MKQLSELRQLHDNGVLTEDEYEEQREELVQLMRQLKNYLQVSRPLDLAGLDTQPPTPSQQPSFQEAVGCSRLSVDAPIYAPIYALPEQVTSEQKVTVND